MMRAVATLPWLWDASHSHMGVTGSLGLANQLMDSGGRDAIVIAQNTYGVLPK